MNKIDCKCESDNQKEEKWEEAVSFIQINEEKNYKS